MKRNEAEVIEGGGRITGLFPALVTKRLYLEAVGVVKGFVARVGNIRICILG